jgi:gliding motility-associated-like protein
MFEYGPLICRVLLLYLSSFYLLPNAISQKCPPNIDFETGTFDGWTCYVGSVAVANGANQISLSPTMATPERHTMYTATAATERDPYGGFPVLCPNGSGHSIKLGNSTGGGQAEGISYEFTIPATENKYSLIYHYAVVFQDPNHAEYQQPRMEIEIMNVSDAELIQCSSFTFIPFGSVLPGFFESPNPGTPTPVWCKDWTAVTINLDNLAGKTIRMFFKTADCTFTRHFGYAYIDVDSECSGTFVGAAYCKDDTAVNVVAPFGYQNYTWYDSTLVNVIGSSQTLTLKPAPKPGTMIAVKVEPYNGYGCPQTLLARLLDTLTVRAYAGIDGLSCNKDPVRIGGPPRMGLVYNWAPTTGLSDAAASNPWAGPDVTTRYILTTRNNGGGCVTRDTVVVTASVLDTSIRLSGKAIYCLGNNDSAVLRVQNSDEIQWYRNNIPIPGATSTSIRVKESGDYFAILSNDLGCAATTNKQTVFIDNPKAGVRYPVQFALENTATLVEAREFGNSFLWAPSINLDDPGVAKPYFRGKGEYEYTVTIGTETGCITIDTAMIKTVKQIDIVVPTAFTPNNDGLNDFLAPVLMGVKQLTYFRIYNRWGQLLYESSEVRPGWNGKYKGLELPTAAVVWIAQGMGVDGKVYMKKGTSVLIR